VVAEMATVRTTVALPESWQGDLTVESARRWIDDRDSDASMSLIAEIPSEQPVGILVLGEVPLPGPGVDLRIGYLFAESSWGRGLATELVSGVIDWARTQPGIRMLTGGVDPENRASVRVLEKCGFRVIDDPDPGAIVYRFEIAPGDERDPCASGWNADDAGERRSLA
jgi:RimJ/RimL family protein N-acetyltransferase